MTLRVPVTFRALAAFVIVASSAVRAGAQTRLTLDDAIVRAITSSHRVADARARMASADATIVSREAQTKPTVTASSGFMRTNHVEEFGIRQPDGSLRVLFPDIPNNYRARAELGLPLYTSGRLQSAVDAARADRSAADADAWSVVADLMLETSVAYWSVATSVARVSVLERALERADQVVADVTARVDAGLLPPNERLTAQAQRARQRVTLIQATNDQALAEAALARLIGAGPDERLVLATPVTTPSPGAEAVTTADVAQLAARAASARADRRAMVFRSQSLRDAANALTALTRPQVAAVAALEPARPNARFVPRTDQWHVSWDLGVAVTWSLWDGGRSRADRQALTAQADAVQARVAEFDSLVALDIRQRQLDMQSARAALEAVGEALTAATEARRVVGERFAAGVAVSADVLDANVNLLEIELEQTRLEASLRVSEARLMRAVGGR